MIELDFRKSVADRGIDTKKDGAIPFAEEIERLGYGGLWHGHFMVGDLPGFDTLQVLTAVAARTSRIMLGTAVLQVPIYHPVDLARRIVTLDNLSDGRFLFGIGSGGDEWEYETLGLPFNRRVSRCNEILDVMKRLWTTDEPITYEGQHFNFTHPIQVLPKPVTKPHPKLVIAGTWRGMLKGRQRAGQPRIDDWSPAAITRIATYGDGWITNSSIPPARATEVVKDGMDRIRARAKELGRTINHDEFELVAETGAVNINPKNKALEEGENFWSARVARGYHQTRGNPSLESHLTTGVYGDAQEVADFMLQWIEVKKTVPALKRIQINLGTMDLVAQLHRFHDEVYPLIEKDLKAA
ncbi:MAG: Luciferase-like, subgroup [Chloroflexi bacterium]|nr:Luciferase-like, subgroup [Chloroflexota bacterium]